MIRSQWKPFLFITIKKKHNCVKWQQPTGLEFTFPGKRNIFKDTNTLSGDVDQWQNKKLGPNYLAGVRQWVRSLVPQPQTEIKTLNDILYKRENGAY